jgi:ABC-2 type transport system permease protein
VALRWAVRLNPLTYGVDGLRAALIGSLSLVMAIDFVVLAALAMLLLSIASYLFSRIQA